MTDDRAAINNAELDRILAEWHEWAKRETVAEGFADKALVLGDFPGYGLQHESQLEQKYAEAESSTCQAVDAQVDELVEPYRAAIYANARNLACGCVVWSSHFLSRNPVERAATVKTARSLLIRRLSGAGIGNWLLSA